MVQGIEWSNSSSIEILSLLEAPDVSHTNMYFLCDKALKCMKSNASLPFGCS